MFRGTLVTHHALYDLERIAADLGYVSPCPTERATWQYLGLAHDDYIVVATTLSLN